MRKVILGFLICYISWSIDVAYAQSEPPRAYTFANPQQYGAGAFGLFNEAHNLTRIGRYEDAILRYGDVLAINPIFSEAYYRRSILLHRLGRKEEASNDLRIAISLNPRVIDLFGTESRLRRLHVLAFQESDYMPVEAWQNEANPETWNAYKEALATALDYKSSGEIEAALDAINLAFLHETAETPELYKLRANIFLLRNDNWLAIEDYNKAIRLNPNFAEAYFNRGLAYILENNRPDGCLDLQQGVLLGYRAGEFLLQSLCGF
ncbi:MAG: tetratricopeptide repeat protein [Saprospiraceae bacterium]|nr:tetratricopeptide repeat protein [Saprospiraceae bacterium]